MAISSIFPSQVAQRFNSLHNQLFVPTRDTRNDVYLTLEVLLRCSSPMKVQARFTWSPPMQLTATTTYVHPLDLSVSNSPLAQFLLHLPLQIIPLLPPPTSLSPISDTASEDNANFESPPTSPLPQDPSPPHSPTTSTQFLRYQ